MSSARKTGIATDARAPASRRWLKRGLSFAYRQLDSRQRFTLGRVPGLLPLFRRVIRPLLMPPRTGDGIVTGAVHGFTMCVLEEEMPAGFFEGAYEPATTYAFQSLLQTGDVVVDVGAHWGYFSLLAGTLCGPQGRVFAFEPHPGNFRWLLGNIESNHLHNVLPLQLAVSDKEGKATLFFAKQNLGGSLVAVPPGAKSPPDQEQEATVETISLDSYFADSRTPIRLIKIDIEGGEPRALAGMKRLIQRTSVLALILEFNPFYLHGRAADEFVRGLVQMGFVLAILDDARRAVKLGPESKILQELLKRGYTTNLLCVRDPADLSRVANASLPEHMATLRPRITQL